MLYSDRLPPPSYLKSNSGTQTQIKVNSHTLKAPLTILCNLMHKQDNYTMNYFYLVLRQPATWNTNLSSKVGSYMQMHLHTTFKLNRTPSRSIVHGSPRHQLVTSQCDDHITSHSLAVYCSATLTYLNSSRAHPRGKSWSGRGATAGRQLGRTCRKQEHSS